MMNDKKGKENNAAYENDVEVKGRVLRVDVAAGTLDIWPDENSKITGVFTKEQERLVLNAIQRHSDWHTEVRGRGEFVDGKLKRILKVDSLINRPDLRPVDPNAPRIEDKILKLFEDAPQEELDRLPTDLSYRLDYYLYGIDR